MPCRPLTHWLVAAGLYAMLLLWHQPLAASARSLPAATLDAAQYTAPPIQLQSPAAGAAGRKIKSQPVQGTPIFLKSATELSTPDVGMAACTEDLPRLPSAGSGAVTGVAKASAASSTASQIERLRATAAGASAPDQQSLSTARQQRLQASAAWQMGLLTLHGICVVLNTADAAVWFERAQQLGEPLAPAALAWCEIAGCKAAANPAAARKWIELLRKVDAPRAAYLQWQMQSRLAPLEMAQPGVGSPGQLAALLQNRALLASAAQLGDTNAKIEMGLDSVFLNQLPAALAFFKSAAPRSAAAGMNVEVVAERLKNASRAAASGGPNITSEVVATAPLSAAGNLALAQRYHRGNGVPSNYAEAIVLYQLAQNQGSTAAKKMLALIFSRPTADGKLDLAWMQQLAQVDLSTAVPVIDAGNVKHNLKREPTPLFDLVPPKWKRYVPPAVGS